jgi:TonB-dependent receptor
MSERVYTFGTDFVLPVSSGKFKFGSFLESKTTGYAIRYFNAVPDYVGGIPDSLTHLPLETIYAPENFGPGRFLFVESSKATDSYNGDQKLYAAYLMVDVPFDFLMQQFRFVGGARLEDAEQVVTVPRTTTANGLVTTTRLKNVDVLPSLNFTYIINRVTNLRFAYSHSVSRPDFRELASTGFYDYIKYELVGGNPDLKRSSIRNYEVRLEIFPEIGEVLAITYFHKSITDAIEEKLVQTATRTRTWFNSERAMNSGWEVELRKSFAFLGGYFKNFSATVNYMSVKSEVEVAETEGNSQSTHLVVSTRPLQGQSPYTVNVSLLFTEPNWGTSINILYNRFGRRLDAVGFLTADIYEDPRDLLDLSITQPITSALDLKFAVRNLADKYRVLTRDNQLYERTSTGRTYSLQLSLGL